MLLVTGPSGNVGAELVDLLAAQGTADGWRVAGRHPDALRTRLADTSADVVRLDFFDRSTWPAALDGVEVLFLLFPLPGNRAARQAMVPSPTR